MVKPGHELSKVDRVLEDRLMAELKKLICGRSVAEAVVLLTFINHALETAGDVRGVELIDTLMVR